MDVLQRAALMRHLHNLEEPVLYGKLMSLRDQIGEWLGYIPATFPHYTRHTVGHSDEIVRQISSLLFEDQDWRKPILPLSASEIYAVIAAAYLHDAGMVASEREKIEILSSPDWVEWVTSGSGSRRWSEIEELRSRTTSEDSQKHFIADLQTRFLIAEYIRRHHSIRAASFLEESNELFTAYYFPDPAMLRTVADICVGHGLDWRELENSERYPLRRDVADGPMNVRLLAVLLRLGDLLDLSYDRACPLLLNAAAPLPYDSLANWSQYRRIVHRLTDTKRIEITAECATQDEHRILRDWCQWIQDETEHAVVLIQGSNRHGAWRPPMARLNSPDATINIRPMAAASYIPVDWTFEIDENTVFERLIVDAYQGPLDAIRELLQNAADANRCVLAQNLRARGIDYSGWVEETEKDVLESLQIKVTISEIDRKNELSGEVELKTIVTVEDTGIGMDRDVIQRYLLQVGRSYYSSRDFQQAFGFVPTSRFGIGFLSVFSVSDRVEVDTFKPSSGGKPLKLRLTGPKSYVLLDQGSRNSQGTNITLELRESISATELIRAVSNWCRRLEFPVIVQSLKDQSSCVITAEQPAGEVAYPLDIQDLRAIRYSAIPIKTSATRGELYVFETLDDQGNWRWDKSYDYAKGVLHRTDPLASLPLEEIEPLLCLHGITVPATVGYREIRLRIDYRAKHSKFQVGLGRSSWGRGGFPPPDEEVDDALVQIWTKHCDDLDVDWSYRQNTAYELNLPKRILYDLPATVRAFDHEGKLSYFAMRSIRTAHRVIVVSVTGEESEEAVADGRLRLLTPDSEREDLYILAEDFRRWAYKAEEEVVIENRRFNQILLRQNVVFEYLGLEHAGYGRTYIIQVLLADLHDEPEDVLIIGSPAPGRYSYSNFRRVAINSKNPLFRELNQALNIHWEVGETRQLSDVSTVTGLQQDELSRVIAIIIQSRKDYQYKNSISLTLRSLVNSGKIPATTVSGLKFEWNEGRLFVRRIVVA